MTLSTATSTAIPGILPGAFYARVLARNAGGSYLLRIVAVNGVGASPASNIVTLVVPCSATTV